MSDLDQYRGPGYRRLLAAARRSLERTGGELTGRISVAEPDDAERKAIIGITGVHQPPGTRRMTVGLADLDTALRRSAGLGLADLLGSLGEPLRDRPAAASTLAGRRAALTGLVCDSPLHDSCPWYRNWLDELTRDGSITRLANQGDTHTLTQAVSALEQLSALELFKSTELPAFSARVTGDTKALNHGTALATLVLRGLALREDVPRPASAQDRRRLWDMCGVIVDDLASRVLVLNLAAGGDGLGEWLTGAARYGTPFQITLHQLASHPIRLPPRRVYACENPAVLRRACAELGPACPPLLCAEGQPSTAFWRVARAVIAAGGELAYHGDFDWPGIAITAAVTGNYAAVPWRMTALDYRAGAGSGGISGGIALAGQPVPTPWDPALREAMVTVGRAVYEETVASSLLADLASG